MLHPWRGIEKTPGLYGGDITETRIPVWVLVNARNIGISKAQLLRDYPTLSATNFNTTWLRKIVHEDPP